MAAMRNRRKGSGASTFLGDDFSKYNAGNNYGFDDTPASSVSVSNTAVPTFQSSHLNHDIPTVPRIHSHNSSSNINNKRCRVEDQPIGDSRSSQESVEYPESLGSFADGLKGDLFELFETGAKALNKSFKLLLPFGEGEGAGGADTIRDIEIRKPLQNITNEFLKKSGFSSSSGNHNMPSAPPSGAKSVAATAAEEAALRMRSQSMWTDKKNSSGVKSDAPVFLPMPKPQNLFPSSLKEPLLFPKENPKLKEGVKVQLSKLDSNANIQVRINRFFLE